MPRGRLPRIQHHPTPEKAVLLSKPPNMGVFAHPPNYDVHYISWGVGKKPQHVPETASVHRPGCTRLQANVGGTVEAFRLVDATPRIMVDVDQVYPHITREEPKAPEIAQLADIVGFAWGLAAFHTRMPSSAGNRSTSPARPFQPQPLQW